MEVLCVAALGMYSFKEITGGTVPPPPLDDFSIAIEEFGGVPPNTRFEKELIKLLNVMFVPKRTLTHLQSKIEFTDFFKMKPRRKALKSKKNVQNK